MYKQTKKSDTKNILPLTFKIKVNWMHVVIFGKMTQLLWMRHLESQPMLITQLELNPIVSIYKKMNTKSTTIYSDENPFEPNNILFFWITEQWIIKRMKTNKIK